MHIESVEMDASEEIVVDLDFSRTCSVCGARGAALFGERAVPLCFDHAAKLPEEDWRYAARGRSERAS